MLRTFIYFALIGVHLLAVASDGDDDGHHHCCRPQTLATMVSCSKEWPTGQLLMTACATLNSMHCECEHLRTTSSGAHKHKHKHTHIFLSFLARRIVIACLPLQERHSNCQLSSYSQRPPVHHLVRMSNFDKLIETKAQSPFPTSDLYSS